MLEWPKTTATHHILKLNRIIDEFLIVGRNIFVIMFIEEYPLLKISIQRKPFRPTNDPHVMSWLFVF